MDTMDTLILVGLILFFTAKWSYKVALWILVIGGSFIVGKKVWDLTIGDNEITLANVLSAINKCREGKE